MASRPDRDRWLALLAAAAAAAYVIAFRLGESRSTLVALDVYGEFYPNILYALESLRGGGRGLLWNPFQNCGQPFFGMSDTGLLYPANLLFLVLERGHALRGVLFFNLVVAGFFAYWLCRELGAGRIAALGGALAFELGNAIIGLTLWTPMAAGPFVWLPAAMLCTERLLRAPTLPGAVALAAVLALALLPGYPQPVVFIYQLIALRVAWEIASRGVAGAGRAALTIGIGLTLPPLLIAVQLGPWLEVARESVRNAPLTLEEMSPQGFLTWKTMRLLVTRRSSTQALVLAPCLIAAAAVWRPQTRRRALFYLAAGVLYYVLAFGPNTPLFALYMKLPLGRVFHDPERFMWMTSFSLAVLTALGIDAVMSATAARARWTSFLALASVATATFGFAWYGRGLQPREWVIAGVAASACLVAGIVPRFRGPAGIVLLGALLLNLVGSPPFMVLRFLESDAPLFTHARLFERLRARMTPQDRIYVASAPDPDAPPFALMQKSPSLFRVPAIFDYQPAMGRRYAEFFVMLRRGRPMENLNQVLFSIDGWFPPGFSRRLLDLTGSRYVVASATVKNVPGALELVDEDAGVRVYHNAQALPRALYVPRLEAVADPRALLRRLAFGPDDPRRVALVDGEPPSGFTGVPGNAAGGSVTFVRNDPEHLSLRVRAPDRGFLLLTDQYFPGWRATVDGRPTAIVRANHAFRLVEVPAGDSDVEFRYTPRAPWIGAAVTGFSVVAVGALMVGRRRLGLQ